MIEEQMIVEAPPVYKLYTPKQISIGTFFGGPIAAGYFIAHNFKALEQPRAAKLTWILCLSFFLLLIVLTLFVPIVERIPDYVFVISYTILASSTARKYFDTILVEHKAKGGYLFSAWNVFLVVLLILIIFVALVFGLIALAGLEFA